MSLETAETRPRPSFPESRVAFPNNINGWHRIFSPNRSSTTRSHTSNTFAALIRLSTTTHNLHTFNISEISSNNSEKLSLLPDTYTRLIQVPGCRVTRSADHLSLVFTPEKTTSWPGSKFTFNFALTLFISLLRACSRGQRLSGHLTKAIKIVPFCLS